MKLAMDGTIVIGEGERDEAPMLFIGEKIGAAAHVHDLNFPAVDIAVDPLEGTNLCATGAPARSPCWPRANGAVCCTRPICTWKKSSWGRPVRAPSSWTRPSRDNLRAIAKRLDRDDRRSRRHRARSPAPRETDSRTFAPAGRAFA